MQVDLTIKAIHTVSDKWSVTEIDSKVVVKYLADTELSSTYLALECL